MSPEKNSLTITIGIGATFCGLIWSIIRIYPILTEGSGASKAEFYALIAISSVVTFSFVWAIKVKQKFTQDINILNSKITNTNQKLKIINNHIDSTAETFKNINANMETTLKRMEKTNKEANDRMEKATAIANGRIDKALLARL